MKLHNKDIKMISFICCSIKLDEAEVLRKNIEKNVGVPFEFLIFDNRTAGYGICKAYNMYAEKAKYEYLCFVHEDVKFSTLNFGKLIVSKLKEDSCGVIGFAGSTIIINYPTGWFISSECRRANYLQHFKRKRASHKYKNPDSLPFSPVITLDGLCLFVSKRVWQEYKFDESFFLGFHLYDLDFSVTVAQKYKNYVCNNILVEHFSDGSYSSQWYEETLRFQKKWEGKFPIGIIDAHMTPRSLAKYLRIAKYTELKFNLRNNQHLKIPFLNVRKYIASYPNYFLSWKLLGKYFKYKLQYTLRHRKQK